MRFVKLNGSAFNREGSIVVLDAYVDILAQLYLGEAVRSAEIQLDRGIVEGHLAVGSVDMLITAESNIS